MNQIIEVEHLAHRFGNVVAIDDLTYQVCEGEVFGMLGPNGAGKTTNIRILNGLLRPAAGKVRILGMDPIANGPEVRRNTGVLTETPSIYERLSAYDNLMIFGTLYGIPANRIARQVDTILVQFGLSERAGDKTGGFSKGMKQRLALARAFLHEPQILFLDEPTSGLDPEAAHQVTQLIEKISHQKGRTVFLCTHNLDEAQRLCDRVAVINKGKLLAAGTQEELSRILWRSTYVDIECDQDLSPALVPDLCRLDIIRKVEINKRSLTVQLEDRRQVPDLVAALVAQGVRILQVNLRKHTLEDIYFAFQNQEVENEPA
jgi:ABC-2 type transport system ATP-binding protein